MNCEFDSFNKNVIIWPTYKYILFGIAPEELIIIDLYSEEKHQCFVFTNSLDRKMEISLKASGWLYIHNIQKKLYQIKLDNFLKAPYKFSSDLFVQKQSRQLDLSPKEKILLSLFTEAEGVSCNKIESSLSIQKKSNYRYLSNLQSKLNLVGIKLSGNQNGQYFIKR